MKSQRDEALKHCWYMLRALQQVSQAVGEAGNVGPIGTGTGYHKQKIWSTHILLELAQNLLEIAMINEIPQGNNFNWYRSNGDYNFNSVLCQRMISTS